jgi:hypothetical protein
VKSQYTVREYHNGAVEVIYTSQNLRKITYSNGDIVWFDRTKVPHNRDDLRGGVVKIKPYDSNTIWKNCDNIDTRCVDAIKPHAVSSEATQYNNQQVVLRNLRNNPRHYDKLVSAFISCKRCNGTGEIKLREDVGEWENEGGSVRNIACECKGERVRITEDMVKRFFDIPLPSRDIKLCVRRSGACGFDINIYATENPALQDTAMKELETLLFNDKNFEWLYGIYPSNVSYESGVSYKHFSGEPKECQTLLNKWFKNVQQKVGQKNVSIESQLQV